MDDHLTEYDAEQADWGYYDALLTINSVVNQTGGAGRHQVPPDWKPLRLTDAVYPTNDIFMLRLRPSWSTTFKRVPLFTNQWGMRDQEYTHAKPDSTYRIALLGRSSLNTVMLHW